MANSPLSISQTAIELLELSNVDSPYAGPLYRLNQERLIQSLLDSRRIDQSTADSLRQ